MTPTDSREFDVDDETPLPPFQSLPAITRIDDPSELELETVYLDTADVALAARRTKLSRRTGGTAPGWHLKLPTSEDECREHAEPFGTDPDHIPAALLQEVRGCVRDRALVPIARSRTRRTIRRLRGSEDVVLAVVSDDGVHADRLVPAPASTEWREWEIELVSGDTTLLEAIQVLLLGAGARPSETRSKLARVLGDRLPTPWPTRVRTPRRKGSAAAALLRYVHEQVRMLGAQDPLVGPDEPDALHQMRVACRRLRSVLATYRLLVNAETANLK